MLTRSSFSLSDNIDHVTTPFSSHLLVCGERAALIDTSPICAYSWLEAELLKFLNSTALLKFVLLTNASFSHIGCIPFLRKREPELHIVASPAASNLLAQETYLRECYEQNVAVSRSLESPPAALELEEWLSAFKVNQVISDGDVLDLGLDVTIRAVATPSYRPDSLAYYIRPDAALAVGEALGSYSSRNKAVPCFSLGLTAYTELLDVVSSLELNMINLPYSGVISGELVKRCLDELQTKAHHLADFVEEQIRQGVLLEELVDKLAAEWATENIAPEGPYSALRKDTIRTMIKSLIPSS